jgi:hypothetical protein
MKEDAIASIEPNALIEEEILERNKMPQGREPGAEQNPHEYFRHIERLEVRFIIENFNKPFIPADLREKRKKDGLRDKHEGKHVKSGDIKTTISFEEGTAPTDGNTEELTDIFIDHMWNFVREVKGYG